MTKPLQIPRAGSGAARGPVLSALLLMCGLCAALTAAAAPLPLAWRADWPNCKPVEKLLHRGVDVALQPTFYVNGVAADTNGWNLTTYVQTNAVGPWFGPLPGAFFSHTNDVGAAFYSVMVRAETPGGSVNYTAFARFRMLDSPGFLPGELPLPVPAIDFAEVTVLNPPWPTPSDIASATNGLASVETVAAIASGATNYTDSAIAADYPPFSNAVLSVGLGIDTNAIAAINALLDESDSTLPSGGTTTLCALLAALAAAVAALKKMKADKTELPYLIVVKTPTYSTTDTTDDTASVTLDDRAVNDVTLGQGVDYAVFTLPARVQGRVRDVVLRLTITASEAPGIVWLESGGGSPNFDSDDDAWSDIEPGVNLIMLTDTTEEAAS